jgi:hypothetical protein
VTDTTGEGEQPVTDTHPPGKPNMLDWALAYARAGTPVFPCAVAGMTPITASGFHDATTDPDQIRAWWARTPDVNIAAPTGATTFDVLDVDVRPDGTGWDALVTVRDAGLLDGWFRAVQTPSGGLHLHYPGTTQRNGSIRGQHLDFRATGGYVLLPPSLGQTKTYSRRYRVMKTTDAPTRPLDWAAVTTLLAPAPPARTLDPTARNRPACVDPMTWLAAHVARQPEGNRNNALFWAACRAAEAGVTDYEPLIAGAVTAGIPERQATRTVESARLTIGRAAANEASRVPSVESITR